MKRHGVGAGDAAIRLLYLSLGFFSGVLAPRLFHSDSPRPAVGVAAPAHEPCSAPPGPAQGDDGELTNARNRIASLEGELQRLRAAGVGAQVFAGVEPTSDPDGSASTVDGSAGGAAQRRQKDGAPRSAVAWRISAIEKFVPLTDEQRRRLQERFSNDSGESLEEILGEENARFYRQQVDAAFKKAQEEEVDREVVWLSRQLALAPAQEREVQEIFRSIEAELDNDSEPPAASRRTPEERVKAMIAENKRRSELRAEKLKGVLSDDQYQVFIRSEAESSASDVEVFHGGE